MTASFRAISDCNRLNAGYDLREAACQVVLKMYSTRHQVRAKGHRSISHRVKEQIMGLTQEIAHFVARTRYRDIPLEVVRLAQGFILDGLGVALAGSTDECARIVQDQIRQMAGKEEAAVVGTRLSAPVAKAALANGVAGHAMDYDDTQLSTSKEAVYGLLTHPTTPVLAAVLAIGEKQQISGDEFLLAYLTGVEVECRIADAINPRHYQDGFHSTATMGGLGAAMAAGKILRLKETELIRTLGIAASMASGRRENFGTMTKPLHAGRAAENGVTAALLAQAGFTSATNINAEEAIQLVGRLEELRSLKPLLRVLSGGKDNSNKKTKATKAGSKKWSRTRKR
jgi:2-methylcitrate dehydratase PrpD